VSPAVTHVVAGILRDTYGRILIAQRRSDAHLAGGWEFPGGKVGPEEAPRTALMRELREELGIEVERVVVLATLTHDYPEKSVLLEFSRVLTWRGEPRGLEGQRLRWEIPDRLIATGLLAADEPVALMLSKPSDRIEHRA
jgi:8-oxo-dGTP diphosphatase